MELIRLRLSLCYDSLYGVCSWELKEKLFKVMFVNLASKPGSHNTKWVTRGSRVKKPSLFSNTIKNILNQAVIFPTFEGS